MSKLICLVLTTSALLLTGCGGPAVKNMVPETTPLATPRFDATIFVGAVSGAQKETFGGPSQVQNDRFRETLAESLRASGLFRAVVPAEPAKYRITADLVAQGQAEGLDYEQALVVEYVITDTSTSTVAWRQGFNSKHKVTLAQEFAGAARTVKAQEGAVRKNLKQLLDALLKADLKGR